jgi:hypothetical protein
MSAPAWETSLVGARVATPGIPSGINDENQIVGSTGGRGVVWREGESATDLGHRLARSRSTTVVRWRAIRLWTVGATLTITPSSRYHVQGCCEHCSGIE